jgi:geranylgeranyl reductase family protein
MNGLQEFDIAIVGTGPAGGSAAMELAGSGLRVAIIEKQALPRYKTCGGGVLARAVKLLPVDISQVVQCECNSVAMNLNGKLRYAVRRAVPVVSMVMRDEFDHLLVKRAMERGVELIGDCEVRGVCCGVDGVELETSVGKIRARIVIAADGAAGRTGKLAGFADHRVMIPAMECEASVDVETFERYSAEARFDFDAVPSGYGWVFPKREHLSIGVGNWPGKDVHLREHLKGYMERLGIVSRKAEMHGYVIPMLTAKGMKEAVFAARGILLCGDAAGFADPVTGEGITFAIASGQAAGQAVRRGWPRMAEVEREYIADLGRMILPELRYAARLASLLYFHPRARNWVFRFLGKDLVEKMIQVVIGETTYAEQLGRLGF